MKLIDVVWVSFLDYYSVLSNFRGIFSAFTPARPSSLPVSLRLFSHRVSCYGMDFRFFGVGCIGVVHTWCSVFQSVTFINSSDFGVGNELVTEMASLSMPMIGRKWRAAVHALGLCSVGSALFLQSTVFTSILQNGYFRGIENNPAILYSEIGLTGLAITYFGYLFLRFVFSAR